MKRNISKQSMTSKLQEIFLKSKYSLSYVCDHETRLPLYNKHLNIDFIYLSQQKTNLRFEADFVHIELKITFLNTTFYRLSVFILKVKIKYNW